MPRFFHRRFARAALVALGLMLAPIAVSAPAGAADLLFFAAASLRNALEAVAQRYRDETGRTVAFSFASSSSLAKQIEQGAPADLYASADLDWMGYLEKRGLIRPETRADLATNRLVLVASARDAAEVEIAPGFPLAGMLGDGRLAVGDPDHVPAGKYAKSALQSLGVWADLEPKLARTDNVRAALALVSRGEVPFGIVYESDAQADPGVTVVGVFPPETHEPIVYPVARTAGSDNPDASAFLDYLRTEPAMALLRRHGFGPPGRPVN